MLAVPVNTQKSKSRNVSLSGPYATRPLLVELALVESELLTLQDVTVDTAGLARSAGDDGVQATGLELLLQGGLDLALGGEALGLLLLDGLALLDLLGGLLALLLLAPTAEGLAVVGLVPLAEGSGVDLDDGGLGQGVGADQLVVGRVVGDDDDTGLAGAALGGPGEVAAVQAQGAVLVVAAAGADDVDALGADTGVGGLAAGLESALLPCWRRSERMFISGKASWVSLPKVQSEKTIRAFDIISSIGG